MRIRWTSLDENPDLLKEIESIKNRMTEVIDNRNKRHLADSASLLGFISKDLDKLSREAFALHKKQMVVTDDDAARPFSKGEEVTIDVHAAGIVTNDGEFITILRVDDDGVWLDNGEGNKPMGPFDKYSGVRDLGGFLGKQIIRRI